ncbi:unnamed protein product [Rotaria socialis]|uniref:Poly [ADP-ribose] polymerase n=1 Tax=Rotaria socialis TaxID=392032 RepID=A0A820SLP0_9BILA|nr:unnamed protein product [Rotaria socialis]CAF4452420.1 unnamed protein product [Rotaria socialis]
MAAVNCLNEIISIFLQLNVIELSDHELNIAIKGHGKTFSVVEIRRAVQLLGSSLFHFESSQEGLFLIRVEPTIGVCKTFLTGKCAPKMGECSQLHICPRFGHCNVKGCNFPHHFNSGNNRRIVEQSHCQTVNPLLLIRLIRHHEEFSHRSSQARAASSVISKAPDIRPPSSSSSVQPKSAQQVFKPSRRTRRRRTHGEGNNTNAVDADSNSASAPVSSLLEANHQIDISFPSICGARQILMEDIVGLLRLQGFPVQKTLNFQENQYFHQCTLQFQDDKAVDNLLSISRILYKDILLKFKRTNTVFDQKSFILQSKIDLKRGAITIEKFSIYVNILIKNYSYQITDLSSSSEQILLIECNNTFDFSQLYSQQKGRRQLQGNNISLKQIYEIETVCIESTSNPLSIEIIKTMVQPVLDDVFIFTLLSNRTALIEFIHADSLKKWLSAKDATQQKFGVKIAPNVKYVNGDNLMHNSNAMACTVSREVPQRPDQNSVLSQMVIFLGRPKAAVANHPQFSIQYKNYIRSELGIEIKVKGKRIDINRKSMTDVVAKENAVSLLRKSTQNFMNEFAFRRISLERVDEQLNILRENSTIAAFYQVKDNKYMLITKQSDSESVMGKLFPIKSIMKTPTNGRSAAASINHEKSDDTNQKESPAILIPLPWLNSTTTDENTSVKNEIIVKSITLTFNTPAQASLFTDKTFKCCLETYFRKNYRVKLNIEHMPIANSKCLIKIIGELNYINSAKQELLTIISLCRTKTFKETIDSGWIKMIDAVRVIQHQLNISKIKGICQQQLLPVSILVHYIDKEHVGFGVDEQILDVLCRKKLVFATCTSNELEKEWSTLKTKIFARDDYGKDVCLSHEKQTISLFGLPDEVKTVQQLIESKKMDTIQSAVKNEASRPEIVATPKARIPKIENYSKSSESNLYPECTQIKAQTVQNYSIDFDIDEPGFEFLVNQDFHRLLAIVDSKCKLVKQIISHRIQIQIPKAKKHYFDDGASCGLSQENTSEPMDNPSQDTQNSQTNWFLKLFQSSKPTTQPPNSPSPVQSLPNTSNIFSVAIGNSKIIVCTGDLTKQAVDIIVVCSTSTILCNGIISAAGYQVKAIYDQQSWCGLLAFETDGGYLPCKKIVFRPWTCDKNQPQNLKQSIGTFITSVIACAREHNLTTIAFPSIGCGQLGHDPKLIAEYMIAETYRQLNILVHSQFVVSFVLLPEQRNVYDAFSDRLNQLQTVENKPTSISFDKQIVRIKLTGTNNNQLIEYQNKIKQLAQSSSVNAHLTDKNDMSDWPQDVIQKYYDYCLQRRVIPTLDIENSILDLKGSKDAVLDAEKYFFQLTAETLRNARLSLLSSGFIWSVETSPGKWEPYSYNINGLIEDAQLNKRSYVEFLNEKSEQCRLIFSCMEEEYQKRKRKVRRRRVDSSLPNYWDLSSSSNLQRIVLSDSSKEYKDALNQFDSTMKGIYIKIVKIERIQNVRWYKQYAAHRDDFTQRYGKSEERRLFHGCSSTSADKIVQECFNRAFAGVNGTLYGQGVYFHEHAKYSHNYTRSEILNERTMFLALVLIGKASIGNPSMKVPPQGFDTTSDGKHIFVVYHDAGAYGEYIITYK